MGTTADKLNNIINSKENIRQALNEKGRIVNENIPFSQFGNEIRAIESKDNFEINDMSKLFSNNKRLNNINNLLKYCKNVIDASECFIESTDIVGILDLSELDTSTIQDAKYMFAATNATNIILKDTDNFLNCQDFSHMFDNNQNLTSIILRFNPQVSNKMNGLFYNCSNLTNIDLTNFLNNYVTDISYIFSGCYNLQNIDLSRINTSNCNMMYYLFNGCSSIENIDISCLDFSNAVQASGLFYNCSNLKTVILGNSNFSKNVTFENLFSGCLNLKSIDFSGITTSNKLTSLYGAFRNCEKITILDLTNINTTGCTSYYGTFDGTISLKKITGFSCDLIGSGNINTTEIKIPYVTDLIFKTGSTFFGKATSSTARTLTLPALTVSGFNNMAASMGSNTSGYTRTIKISTATYNALTTGQRAVLTGKGYSLANGAV